MGELVLTIALSLHQANRPELEPDHKYIGNVCFAENNHNEVIIGARSDGN